MSEIGHKHIRSLKELLIGNKLDPIRPRIYCMGCSYAKISRAAAIQLLVDLQMSISLLNMKGEK
jgi:hypothetical protein